MNAPLPGVPGAVLSVAQGGVGKHTVVFSEKDLLDRPSPGYDPLVISAQVGTKVVRRILVNTGSSTDILYRGAFIQLGLDPEDLIENRYSSRLLGRKSEDSRDDNFNSGVGRAKRVSIYHGMMKFVAGDKTGMIQESVCTDQNKMNAVAVEVEVSDEQADLEVRVGRELKAAKGEKRSITPFGSESKRVYVGTALSDDCREQIVKLLKASRDIFAWTPKDLKGIPRSLIVHSLHVSKESNLLKEPITSREKARQYFFTNKVTSKAMGLKCECVAICSKASAIRKASPCAIKQVVRGSRIASASDRLAESKSMGMSGSNLTSM
ncbi:hypothetical protein V2J09_015336 [Rumex salicifolius]